MKHSISHLQAIGFALAGYALWVLCDTSIKLAGESTLPFYEIIAFMGLSGATVTLAKTAVHRDIKALLPKNPRAQAGRACLTLVTVFCNVIALRHLSLSIFYIMAFLAPLITAIMAASLLREHLSWKKTIAVVVGFAGVIVAIIPGMHEAHGDWIGYSLMSTAALINATNAVWLRRMSQTETIDSLVFTQASADAIAGFIPMLFYAAPINFGLFVILFAAGALDVAGTVCTSFALRHTTASNVAQFHYTQIITGALIGYLVWDEVPTLYLIAGSVLIIGSGLYIAAHARKAETLAAVSSSLFPPL